MVVVALHLGCRDEGSIPSFLTKKAPAQGRTERYERSRLASIANGGLKMLDFAVSMC